MVHKIICPVCTPHTLTPSHTLTHTHTASAKKIWLQVKCSGQFPSSRDGHACTAIGDQLFIHGGFSSSVSAAPQYTSVTTFTIRVKLHGSQLNTCLHQNFMSCKVPELDLSSHYVVLYSWQISCDSVAWLWRNASLFPYKSISA